MPDILSLFAELSIKTTRKTATEWCSPCPLCGGEDRCSIWPEKRNGLGYWWCRRCESKGDGIQLLIDAAGMTYKEACEHIGHQPPKNYTAPRDMTMREDEDTFEPVPGELDAAGVDVALWRKKAAAFAAWAHQHLMASTKWLHYLADRGIDLEAAKRCRLGFNPGEQGKNCVLKSRKGWGLAEIRKEDGKLKPLWLPRGIVIPQLVGLNTGVPEVHRLRIRRLDEDREAFQPKRKYHVVDGSSMSMMHLPCFGDKDTGIVVVVEAELDAIALHAAAGDVMHCVASMTSNIRRMPESIHQLMHDAPCILVALDKDGAGKDGWKRWETSFPQARRCIAPAGKDPGEAFAAGISLRTWMLAGIPKGLRSVILAPPRQPEHTSAPAHIEDVPIPADVRKLAELWTGKPIGYKHTTDDTGGCLEWGWYYNHKYAREHAEEVHEFIKFANGSDDINLWLERHPAEKITSKNFLSRDLS